MCVIYLDHTDTYLASFCPSSFLPTFPVVAPFLFSDSPTFMAFVWVWIPHVNENRLDLTFWVWVSLLNMKMIQFHFPANDIILFLFYMYVYKKLHYAYWSIHLLMCSTLAVYITWPLSFRSLERKSCVGVSDWLRSCKLCTPQGVPSHSSEAVETLMSKPKQQSKKNITDL